MTKKYASLLLLFLLPVLSSMVIVSADGAQETVLTAEIIEGDLSMTQPNNLNFNAKLNGKEQIIDLEPIQTTITDYLSKGQGWKLTVKSPNFESYASSYQLSVNNEKINKEENKVYSTKDEAQIQAISLPVAVKISDKAQEGSYVADLEWNLTKADTATIAE
ncbi:hypothetical protein VNN41_03275 [Lactococcus garvieae]|uniref:hypothetical protein n=1 Tax=Lactococcus garvieae TaxID=1363 RepID=UPI00324B5671